MWGAKKIEESRPEDIQITIYDVNPKNKCSERNIQKLSDDLNNNNLASETENSESIVQEEEDGEFPFAKKYPIMKMKSPPKNIPSSPAKIEKKVRFKDLGTKIKNKRDPLPMKLRALPHSFWQQPNHPACLSPAPLPPITSNCISTQRNDDLQVAQSNITNNNSQTSSTMNFNTNTPSPSSPSPEAEKISSVSEANTELLFSLFNAINNNNKFIKRRGRPKKTNSPMSTSQARDDDPYLVQSGLLSSLSSPAKPRADTPKTLSYSQLLNDLVFQL